MLEGTQEMSRAQKKRKATRAYSQASELVSLRAALRVRVRTRKRSGAEDLRWWSWWGSSPTSTFTL